MEGEAVRADVVHADAVGAGAGRHVMYVEIIDIPGFGRTAGGENAQGDACVGWRVGKSDGAQVVAIGELGTTITGHGDESGRVGGIGHVTHLQNAAEGAGF